MHTNKHYYTEELWSILFKLVYQKWLIAENWKFLWVQLEHSVEGLTWHLWSSFQQIGLVLSVHFNHLRDLTWLLCPNPTFSFSSMWKPFHDSMSLQSSAPNALPILFWETPAHPGDLLTSSLRSLFSLSQTKLALLSFVFAEHFHMSVIHVCIPHKNVTLLVKNSSLQIPHTLPSCLAYSRINAYLLDWWIQYCRFP